MLNFLFAASSLLGLGLNAYGSHKQSQGQKLQAQGSALQVQGARMQTAASKKSEEARFQQMSLDTARTKRQVIRDSIIQKAQAESNAVNQGAGTEGSSLAGGYSAIDASAGRQIQDVSQNFDIGKQLFDANMDYFKGSEVISQGAELIGKGGGQVAQGQGLSNLGSSIYNSSSQISRLGTFAFSGASSSRSGTNDIFR